MTSDKKQRPRKKRSTANSRGFCVFINTSCEGPVPSVRGDGNLPMVFPTQVEAEREIADFMITRLEEVMIGERDLEDAVGTEEYVVEVDVFADGSVRVVED
jgi:hypothetical protein